MRSCPVGGRSKASLRHAGMAGLIALSACSSHSAPRVGVTLPVTEKDYRISSSVAAVPAGIVSFHVYNRGPSTHEFVVFETTQPADQLPLGADGLTVDEDSPSLHPVGEISQVDIGQSLTLVLGLPPGRYVLLCNLEGHYLGGRYSVVTVN
jgi:uncharacterized cupredoxin-like copper-binding protein